jgi:hypothetical protein
LAATWDFPSAIHGYLPKTIFPYSIMVSANYGIFCLTSLGPCYLYPSYAVSTSSLAWKEQADFGEYAVANYYYQMNILKALRYYAVCIVQISFGHYCLNQANAM